LADSKDVDTLSSELESRLDDLFGETDGALPGPENSDAATHYPLAELKNLILSIDWEITDDTLEQLIQQIKDLKLTYQQDKIVLGFLQILNSLGSYIKTNRGKSHPKTFKILNAVFSGLDKVVLAPDMTEPAKKKILLAAMKRYKELRTRISKDKTAAPPKAKARSAQAGAPKISDAAEERPAAASGSAAQPSGTKISESTVTDQGQDSGVLVLDEPEVATLTETVAEKDPDIIVLGEPGVATLAEAVAEIKKYIHDQISALTKEIKALRKL
jgi:hypothetical protein